MADKMHEKFRIVSIAQSLLIVAFAMVAYISKITIAETIKKPLSENGSEERSEIGKVVQQLVAELEQEQVKKDSISFHPPFSWQTHKGLFPSDINFNFHGNPIKSFLRHNVRVYDESFFVTGWVVAQLLEAKHYGNLDGLKPEVLLDAVITLKNFADRNHPNGSSMITFWPQVFNLPAGLWTESDPNVMLTIKWINKFLPWSMIKTVLRFFGLEQLSRDVSTMVLLLNRFQFLLPIPSDFDDSSLNTGIGALLKQSPFQKVYAIWASTNFGPKHLVEKTRAYAYRPFSSDINSNLIDPRTYYMAESYILKAQEDKKPLAIITTWAQNLTEIRKMQPLVSTPRYVNNVDVAVAINTVYGLCAAALTELSNDDNNLPVWFDEELVMIVQNTTDFVCWTVESGLVQQRPELTLLYYPSIVTFHWFLSRVLFLLETNIRANMKIPELFVVRDRIAQATEAATKWILAQSHFDSKTEETFFDDFLGNGDTGFFGRNKTRAESRVFTTAMAINALFGYHTYFDGHKKKIYWKNGTVETLKVLVTNATSWLLKYAGTSKYQKMNAFFTPSVKGYTSYPFLYPCNFVQYLNGSHVHMASKNPFLDHQQLVCGLSGTLSEPKYSELTDHWNKDYLNLWNQSVPQAFPGYNAAGAEIFPFWSAPPLTRSTVVLALSQAANVMH